MTEIAHVAILNRVYIKAIQFTLLYIWKTNPPICDYEPWFKWWRPQPFSFLSFLFILRMVWKVYCICWTFSRLQMTSIIFFCVDCFVVSWMKTLHDQSLPTVWLHYTLTMAIFQFANRRLHRICIFACRISSEHFCLHQHTWFNVYNTHRASSNTSTISKYCIR